MSWGIEGPCHCETCTLGTQQSHLGNLFLDIHEIMIMSKDV